jgi:hypothetical protein
MIDDDVDDDDDDDSTLNYESTVVYGIKFKSWRQKSPVEGFLRDSSLIRNTGHCDVSKDKRSIGGVCKA